MKMKLRTKIDFFVMRRMSITVVIFYLFAGLLNGISNFSGEYAKMFNVLAIESFVINAFSILWFSWGSWNGRINQKATYYTRIIRAASGEVCVYASLFFIVIDAVLVIFAFNDIESIIWYIISVMLVKILQILYIPFYRKKKR